MDNRTFKVAGISTDPKGSTKIRFRERLCWQNQNLEYEKTHRHQIGRVREANEQKRDL